MPTSSPNSNFTLTLQDLIIENENGEATDIDKVYLHNCSNKTVYESSSLVKNQDSLFKNSYTAKFNIPIDKDNKKDTKLIIYSNDLSKTHTTKDIHKRSDTAVISLSYKDKNSQSFCYLRKTSLRDITNNIINVISDNEYPFKTNEDITLKAIYKQEEKDEQGNDNKKYKEVVWGYKVIKTVEYNEVSKSNPKDVIPLKNKKDKQSNEGQDNESNKKDGLIKGKEITIQISKVVTKDDLAKLKQGGYSIIFFAALKEKEKKKKETNKKKKQNNKPKDTKEVKFQFNTNYGKTHMRVDVKIPLYIKFKDDRVTIYEFEHAIKEKVFKASLRHDDVLVNKSKEESKNIKDGYYYINKNIDQVQDIKIYEDDKLSKTLNVKDEKNSQTLNNVYVIYIDDNSANSQILDSIISKDKKYGINLLSKDNMDKFISSFNDSKSLTRVDKGMWEDGDEGVKVLIGYEDCICLKDKFTEVSCSGNGCLIAEWDYKKVAEDLGVEKEVLKAIAKQESHGRSFYLDGQATILFERHIMRRCLIKKGYSIDQVNKLQDDYPDIVNTQGGSYNVSSYTKLGIAKKIDYDCAVQSCSWGKFQVMGLYYSNLYSSPSELEEAMNKCELQQFRYFLSYLKNTNGMIIALKNKDWESIARLYNGANWKKQNPKYASNIEKYYNQFKGEK